jgi:hypothetical protein
MHAGVHTVLGLAFVMASYLMGSDEIMQRTEVVCSLIDMNFCRPGSYITYTWLAKKI